MRRSLFASLLLVVLLFFCGMLCSCCVVTKADCCCCCQNSVPPVPIPPVPIQPPYTGRAIGSIDNIIPQGRDKYGLVASLQTAIVGSQVKYSKTAPINVSQSTYARVFYNVPFLSPYQAVGNVVPLFVFELDKTYFRIFPDQMRDQVLDILKKFDVKQNDFHIFVNYQYLLALEGDDTNDNTILFRPHFFIAKDEINKAPNVGPLEGTIYGMAPNVCVVYDSNKAILVNEIHNWFSVHDGKLSGAAPSIQKTLDDVNGTIGTFYSFVLESKKNIAAMTIHFLKQANFGEMCQTQRHINAAMMFARSNHDDVVCRFLASIRDMNKRGSN